MWLGLSGMTVGPVIVASMPMDSGVMRLGALIAIVMVMSLTTHPDLALRTDRRRRAQHDSGHRAPKRKEHDQQQQDPGTKSFHNAHYESGKQIPCCVRS